MHSEGYCSCLSVSLIKSHLTSGASVRPENVVMNSAGNEGENTCRIFSETASLWRSNNPSVVRPYAQRPFFTHVCYTYGQRRLEALVTLRNVM